MAGQDAGNDNANADTRTEDNTPESMQGNDTAKTETTCAMGKQKQHNAGKTQQPKKTDARKELTFVKNKGETHIAQLVKTHTKMPEEIELGKERRNQIEELILEYPTGTSKR